MPTVRPPRPGRDAGPVGSWVVWVSAGGPRAAMRSGTMPNCLAAGPQRADDHGLRRATVGALGALVFAVQSRVLRRGADRRETPRRGAATAILRDRLARVGARIEAGRSG